MTSTTDPAMKKKYHKLTHLVPDVVRMRAEGLTIMQIGDQLKLSKQRVSQIAIAARKHEKILREWGFPFTTRTFNVLARLAVKNKDEALSLYHSGHLHPASVTGFGWRSYHEICEWLEVPMLKQRPKQPKTCPHCGKTL